MEDTVEILHPPALKSCARRSSNHHKTYYYNHRSTTLSNTNPSSRYQPQQQQQHYIAKNPHTATPKSVHSSRSSAVTTVSTMTDSSEAFTTATPALMPSLSQAKSSFSLAFHEYQQTLLNLGTSFTTTTAAANASDAGNEERLVMGGDGVLASFGKYMDARQYYDHAVSACYNTFEDTVDMTTAAASTTCSELAPMITNPTGSANRMAATNITSKDSTTKNDNKVQHTMNVASYAAKCGKYTEARNFYTQALDECYEKYGPHAKVPILADIWMQLGRLAAREQQHDTALNYFEKALELKRDIYGGNNNNVNNHDLAYTLECLGHITSQLHRHDLALDYYKQSLAMTYAVVNATDNNNNSDDGTAQKLLAQKHDNIGRLLQTKGDYDGAKIFYTEALQLKQEYYDTQKRKELEAAEQEEEHRDDAATTFTSTTSSTRTKMLTKPNSTFGSNSQARSHTSSHSGNKKKKSKISTAGICASLNALGNLHRILGDYETARDYFTEELHLLAKQTSHSMNEGGRRSVDSSTNKAPVSKEMATVLHNLGNLHCNLNQYPQAKEYFDKALEMKYAVFGLDARNLSLATTLHSMGILQSELGKYGLAEDYFRQALQMKYHVYGKHASNASIANTLNSLGNLAHCRGDYLQAQTRYDQAISMDRKVQGEKNDNHAKTILNRGNMALKLGKYEEAKTFLDDALSKFHELYGGKDAQNLDISTVLSSLGSLYRSQRNFEMAEHYYMKALEMQYTVLGPGARSSVIAETLYQIGILQFDRKRMEAAKKYQEKSLRMIVSVIGNDSRNHPLVQKIAHELIKLEQHEEIEKQNAFNAGSGKKCWVPFGGKSRKKKQDVATE